MTDLKIDIPEEYLDYMEYSGDDLMLSFIIDTINNGGRTFSFSQWVYLSICFDAIYGADAEVSMWLYHAINSEVL